MNDTDNTTMEESTCLKCGIKVDPPTLILLYREGDKLRKKSMPLRHFKFDSNCTFIADEVKKRHELPLPHLKIERMLRVLQEMMQGKTKEEAVKSTEMEYRKKSNANLNELPTHELDKQKEAMNVVFTQNQVKSNDPNFEYDKQIEFKPDGTSEWDEENDEFWDE